jgi:hypothetical protein
MKDQTFAGMCILGLISLIISFSTIVIILNIKHKSISDIVDMMKDKNIGIIIGIIFLGIGLMLLITGVVGLIALRKETRDNYLVVPTSPGIH